MPCDRRIKKGESATQRATTIRQAVETLQALLAAGRVKAIVGAKGGIAFVGWSEQDRADVLDGCAYRRIMATGSTAAKLEIQRAELLAGRTVDRLAVAAGLHSHNGGASWGTH